MRAPLLGLNAVAPALVLLLAGCTSNPPPVTEPEQGDPLETPRLPVSHPFNWNGQMGAMACVVAGARANGAPTCVNLPGSDDRSTYTPAVNGTPRAVTANLTWTAPTPLTQRLEFAVTGIAACRGCTPSDNQMFVIGESPLSVQLQNVTALGHIGFRVRAVLLSGVGGGVTPTSTVDIPGPKGGVYLQPEQAFAISGSVVTLEVPDNATADAPSPTPAPTR